MPGVNKTPDDQKQRSGREENDENAFGNEEFGDKESS